MAAVVLARFRVQDYDKWREVFESNIEFRKGGGCNGAHIFQNASDPNDVTVNFQWDSEENARRFLTSQEFEMARNSAGVTGAFDFWLVVDGGRTTA